ncbi:AAA family ATPase [Photobacterium angustum]|uniref:AAA family ATPase n=1 Tax=Photobacterium angustum TaxID=661 RepID=UPI0006997D8B|nr:AAA family ATPase [Photobacterium angustum]
MDSSDNEISELLEEKIIIDGKVILEKKDDKTIFSDSSLPKIDKYKSNFYILRDNEVLTPLYQSMQSIIMIHNDSKPHMSEVSTPLLTDKSLKKVSDFFDVNKDASIVDYCDKYNDIDCRSKIFFAKKYDSLKFEDFLFVYTSIFSNVESILTKEIEAIPRKGSSKVHHGFQISLKLVDGTIVKQSNISSGMFKTMMLLSDLMFSSKNTVFLIDEIENSLGVNCLPDIIQEIKAANFQCVISTHHPKIINDISPSNWLIVHRDSGVIKTSKATDIENSSSHHDKFIQLINSCIFRDEK